ncbi:hypothetical protein HU200_042418 [Digitaria exilis]|uniref:TF-B3 domain-containing protein n=1 Tax=Digitaria exilis TaxID=1010633 RepID=A0A835EH55_9POAL|nr:hypothetical protein HU200_042418 [Digitaria exilis]
MKSKSADGVHKRQVHHRLRPRTAMAAASGSGSHSAAAAAGKHLRVLLPFSCDRLRIPGELAVEVGDGEAVVVVPFGKGKVMRVEVGADGGGAFLGRGWPELAAACGVGAGWTVVLRHRGSGVLTVKAFEASCCLRELGTLPAGTNPTFSSRGVGAQRKLKVDFSECDR